MQQFERERNPVLLAVRGQGHCGLIGIGRFHEFAPLLLGIPGERLGLRRIAGASGMLQRIIEKAGLQLRQRGREQQGRIARSKVERASHFSGSRLPIAESGGNGRFETVEREALSDVGGFRYSDAAIRRSSW